MSGVEECRSTLVPTSTTTSTGVGGGLAADRRGPSPARSSSSSRAAGGPRSLGAGPSRRERQVSRGLCAASCPSFVGPVFPEGRAGGPAAEQPSALGSSGGARPQGSSSSASSSGLAGLAAVLAGGPKHRLALDAVVGALAEQGVTVPVDLALIGEGDVLPESTIDAVRGGMDVEGFSEAFASMFRVARAGLDVNMSMLVQRIAAAPQPPSLATSSPAVSTAGSKAWRRVRAALSSGPCKVPKRATEEVQVSLAAKEEQRLEQALERCFGLLEVIGASSPRWQRVFGNSPSTRAASRQLQRNAFLGRFQSHHGLDAARRRFEAYIRTMKAMGMDPFAPEEWFMAAFIADQIHRSSSGPATMLQALTWASSAFDMDLRLQSKLVQSQKAAWTGPAIEKDRKPARMATPDMLRMMEMFTTSSASMLWRCWAGVFAALGHGCLRWNDLQHTKNLSLTQDSVFGRTWRMKGKQEQTPWAALRVGLSPVDWGKAWLAALNSSGLPGADYVISAPTSSWDAFKPRPADFYDAQAAMRALLVHGGMSQAEAMSFSCHSWRHLYPTAGRQLDLGPKEAGECGPLGPELGDGRAL